MGESEPTPTSFSRNFLQALSPYFESITKATAAVAFVAYISGYLIVSIHEFSYGFTELNPFKPRILAAGLLFGFLTILPILAAWETFSINEGAAPRAAQKFSRFCVNSLLYFYAISVLMIVGLVIIASDRGRNLPVNIYEMPVWWVGLAVLLVVALVYYARVEKSQSTTLSLLVGLTAVILIAVLIAVSWSRYRGNAAFVLQLWLFGVGIISRPELKWVRESEAGRSKNWSQFAVRLIVVLFLFSQYVYPKIKTSWGGGEPVPVAIYFTKDSPWGFRGMVISDSWRW